MFLSVVLPAYNEEATIERVILEHVDALAACQGMISGCEIVCVDDASSDGTPAILDRLGARLDQLRVIRHQQNRGISESFADLFEAARGTHIYMTGADGQWPAVYLEKMLRAVRTGADLVVGVRSNRAEVYGFKRRLVSGAFNLLPRLLFGVETSDAGSVKLGVSEVFRFNLISRSPFAEAERIIKAQRSGYRVAFVPIEFKARPGGRAAGARWSNIRTSARDCMKCIRVYGLGRRVAAAAQRER